ncbi:MAG: TetR/AcrR family transcriptional regulator, partial [Pigmentiphaga sp.]
EIGVNAATIHYYYPATDDLFIALHARMTERSTADLDAILAARDPLRALWEFQSNWAHSALGVEFIALSNHRKSLQPVLAEATGRARALQEAAVRRMTDTAPALPDAVSPLALTTILVAVSRTLANEERVGITTGHDDVRQAVEWVLATLPHVKN